MVSSLEKKSKVNLFNKEIGLFDFILFGIFALIGFLLFTHKDIIDTAERSFILLDGNILDFYSTSINSHNGGANYLPTTFILFAIWNIPLKILGMVPAFGKSGLIQILWYKLLPVLVYLVSVLLVYKISREEFKLGSGRSKLIGYCFAGFPFAFFSQFVFCQYDIFTVVFMLLGLRHYFRAKQSFRDKLLFCLYFSLAVSCKYFAFAIFAILVVLKEKRILKAAGYLCASLVIPLVQAVVYMVSDYSAFKELVIKFSVLNYGVSSGFSVGGYSVSIMVLFFCVIIAWAYFTNVNSFEELIDYAMYFSCGICFGLFALMSWHPQWLIFGAFFWTVSSCRNKNFKLFMLLDTVAIIVFTMYVINKWYRWVDQTLLFNGVFKYTLQEKMYESALTMRGIVSSNSTFVQIAYTLFVAILLINFIFKHPKYKSLDQTDILSVRVRNMIGYCIFIVPAILCLISMLGQPDTMYRSSLTASPVRNFDYVPIQAHDKIRQEIFIEGGSLTSIAVNTAKAGGNVSEDTGIAIKIMDPESGEVVAKTEIIGNSMIVNGDYTIAALESSEIESKNYELVVYRTDRNYDETVGIYLCPGSGDEKLTANGESLGQRELVLTLGGKKG